MTSEERIRLFGLGNAAMERDLDKVEQSLKIDLQRSVQDLEDEEYYPQFDQALRQEASEMGKHYEVFYCWKRRYGSLLPTH